MAAAKAYRAKTVTFASTAVLGITDVSITDNGSAVDLSTDASPTITAVFVDSIVTDVTVTTTDLDRVTALAIGGTGALVIVFQLRAEGSGAGAGAPPSSAHLRATSRDRSSAGPQPRCRE